MGKSIKEGKWLRGKPTVSENKKEKHDARWPFSLILGFKVAWNLHLFS